MSGKGGESRCDMLPKIEKATVYLHGYQKKSV